MSLAYGAPTAASAPCDPPTRSAVTASRARDVILTANARLGASMAVGNFNNDDYQDLAVGAPGANVEGQPGAGAIFMYLGGPGGLAPQPRSDLGPLPPETDSIPAVLKQRDAGGASERDDNFGAALATGDVDDDGYADLIAGVPGENSGSGLIMVFLGSRYGLTTRGAYYRSQTDAGGASETADHFGAAVATGDLNGGSDDVIVGVPDEDHGRDDTGALAVFPGVASSRLAHGFFKFQENVGGVSETGDRFGAAVDSGEVTGSGVEDIVVGAPGETVGSLQHSGLIAILPGVAGAANGSGMVANGSTRSQESADGIDEAEDHFGAAVAVGDLDGQAPEDIAVGAPGEEIAEQPSGSGAVYVFNTGDTARNDSWLTGTSGGVQLSAGDNFGAALAIRDVDANGTKDLLVGLPGRPGSGGSGAGALAAIGKRGVVPTAGRLLSAPDFGAQTQADARLGAAVAAGDFNRDGFADVVVGAPGRTKDGLPSVGEVRAVNRVSEGVWLGGLVGHTTDTTARVWAALDRRGAKTKQLSLQYRPANGASWVSVSPGAVSATDDDDGTRTFQLTGLVASTQYAYRLIVNGCVEHTIPERTFTTFPSVRSPGPVSFVFGADMAPPSVSKPFNAFSSMAVGKPTFGILGGDQIYDAVAGAPPAAGSEPRYDSRYQEAWSDGYFRSFTSQYPTYMILDDHEICNDYPAFPDNQHDRTKVCPPGPALKAYADYQDSHNPAHGPGGLHYSFRAGPVEVFVLDTRTQRTPVEADKCPTSTGTMLGEKQKVALRQWLTESSGARFKIVVSAVPFTDQRSPKQMGDCDSWAARPFRAERSELLQAFRRAGKVVVVSGDGHWPAAFRLIDPELHSGADAYPLYEFQATPLAIGNHDAVACPTGATCGNTQVLWNSGVQQGNQVRMFARFSVDATTTPAKLTVAYFDAANRQLYPPSASAQVISETELRAR